MADREAWRKRCSNVWIIKIGTERESVCPPPHTYETISKNKSILVQSEMSATHLPKYKIKEHVGTYYSEVMTYIVVAVIQPASLRRIYFRFVALDSPIIIYIHRVNKNCNYHILHQPRTDSRLVMAASKSRLVKTAAVRLWNNHWPADGVFLHSL